MKSEDMAMPHPITAGRDCINDTQRSQDAARHIPDNGTREGYFQVFKSQREQGCVLLTVARRPHLCALRLG